MNIPSIISAINVDTDWLQAASWFLILAVMFYAQRRHFEREHANRVCASNTICEVAIHDASHEYVMVKRMAYSNRDARAHVRALIHKRYGFNPHIARAVCAKAIERGIAFEDDAEHA